MQISPQLLADKRAELAQRLDLEAAAVLITHERGTDIRVPITVDRDLFNTAFLLCFPAVGIYDRSSDATHHRIRIYDLCVES